MKELEIKDIKSRMLKLLDYYKVSKNALGGDNKNLCRQIAYQFTSSDSLTTDIVVIFAERFPLVSMDWLIRGEGSMLKQRTSSENETQKERILRLTDELSAAAKELSI